MFSYIILFLSTILFLSSENILRNDKKIYSLLSVAASFSYSMLGLISLILINLDKSKFPTLTLSILIFFLSVYFNKNYLNEYLIIKNFLLFEGIKIKKYFQNKSQQLKIIIIIFLIILISISSIGPINHPDALDYHVGYPYQFWLRGKFFIDEGLHQALMGAGDYANLSFIQEKTIWLIRYIQIFNLPLILLFFVNNIKNKWFIIAFLSSSTFIQWSTIGKPLFLGESSCAIAYIIWREYKDNLSRKLLIVSIITCISIKISFLIVCLPIVLDIIADYFYNAKNKNLKKLFLDFKNNSIDSSILLSLLLLLAILILRFKIIGNFAFPLLTNIFNKNDSLIENFAEFLSGYQRGGLFPLNIFIPIKFSDIASSLGPGIFIIIILLIIKTFSKFNLRENILFYISFSQIVLLIMFCQGRADYYAVPLIISVYFADNLNIFCKSKFLKLLINLSIIFQTILIVGLLLFSINQNLLSIFNYEKAMINSSYAFDFSRLINYKTSGNFYQNAIRDSRFLFPENYISREKMQKCLINNTKEYCLVKNNITQLISGKEFLLDKQNFNCETKLFTTGARNPLNRKKREVEVCEKRNLSK